MIPQVLIPQSPIPGLHLIVAVEVGQRRLGHVNTTGNKKNENS